MCPHTVPGAGSLGAGSLRSRCGQGPAPCEGPGGTGEGLFLAFLLASGVTSILSVGRLVDPALRSPLSVGWLVDPSLRSLPLLSHDWLSLSVFPLFL